MKVVVIGFDGEYSEDVKEIVIPSQSPSNRITESYAVFKRQNLSIGLTNLIIFSPSKFLKKQENPASLFLQQYCL